MPVDWDDNQLAQAKTAVQHLPETDPRRDTLLQGIAEKEAQSVYNVPRNKEERDAIEGKSVLGGRLPETDAETNMVARANADAHEKGIRESLIAADVDPSLPSASQRKSMFAPPEFHPPPSSLGGPLDALKHFLPGSAGGSTEMYREPTLAEYRKETGDRSGTRDSDEYKHFADLKWKDRVALAEKQGTPVVRTEYMATPTMGSTLKKAASTVINEGPDTVMAGLLGAGDLASGGLLTKNAPKALEKDLKGTRFEKLAPEGSGHVFEDVMADSPIASSLGALAGAAKGIPGKLMAATKGLGGALQGAVASGGTRLAENAAKSLPESLGGEPGFHPSVDSLVLDPLAAAGIGGVIGGVGAKIGDTQRTLREGTTAPEQRAAVRALDKANIGQESTDPLRPFKPVGPIGKDLLPVGERSGLNPFAIFGDTARLTPEMKANFAAESAPGSTISAPQAAVDKVAPKLAENLQAKHQLAQDTWDATVATQMARHGDALVEPRNLIAGLENTAKTHQYAGTEDPIPFSRVLGAAKAALNKAVEISPPAKIVEKIPGSRVMSVADARVSGYDVPTGEPEMKVVIKPRPMDTERFENMMHELSLAANEGKDIGKETYRRWAAAAREDRDNFPGGWSAKHTEFHGKLSEIEGQLRDLGMQPKRNLIPDEVSRGTAAAVKNYRGEYPKDTPHPDKILEQLTGGDPALLQRLREVAAHDAVPKVNAAGKILSTNPVRNLSGIRVSLDPLAGLMGRIAPSAAVAGSSGKLGPGARAAGKKTVSLAGPALNAGFLTLKDIANYVTKDDRRPEGESQ